jgi:hypothetical protein
MQQLTNDYLEVRMKKYRLLNSPQNKTKFDVKRVKYFQSSEHKVNHDQWDYAQ